MVIKKNKRKKRKNDRLNDEQRQLCTELPFVGVSSQKGSTVL